MQENQNKAGRAADAPKQAQAAGAAPATTGAKPVPTEPAGAARPPVSDADARPRRFHIFYALHFLRYGLLLCLVPMLQALIAFDLQALWVALWQDFYILALCVAAALLLWWRTDFSLENNCVVLRRGVLFRRTDTYHKDSIAVLDITRPLYCRMFGAAKMTLFFKNYAAPKKALLYLPKKTAEQIANALMPVRENASVFAPTGTERLALMILSANVITTSVFVWMGAKRVTDLLGQDMRVFTEFAQQNFARIEMFLEQFLPVGMAVVTALVFAFASVTLFFSFLHTAGFRVCRNGGVIICRGGLITRVERRILAQSVSLCDVRVTPVARLLGRYPLYVTAGSFHGGDVPLMVFRRKYPHTPESLLTSYKTPDAPLCEWRRKSIWQYIGFPGGCMVFSLALCGVAFAGLPQMLPVLAVPVLLSAGWLAVSVEGYFKEGVCENKNRTLSVWYTRLFTRHEVCVLTPDVRYTVYQSPFGVSMGYATVSIRMPCAVSLRARGMPQYKAHHMPFTL